MENKAKGLRKIGIGITAISTLSLKPPEDFRVAVIIGVIAIIGIVCQSILDWRTK